ncbi:hypothetical protein [Kutzneria sp. NPDC052558]|uniref:hypothetical protein n=1 Tax=Kutzneria sp. NPDC052558 TaxID=3364121 RepID=UPI0037C81064
MTEDDDDLDAVSVVLFTVDEAGGVRPVGSERAVDLGRGLPAELVGTVLDAAVGLAVPDDIDASLADAITAMPVPAAFRDDPWLHEHRAILLRDNRCLAGYTTLRYREGIGLTVDDLGDEGVS